MAAIAATATTTPATHGSSKAARRWTTLAQTASTEPARARSPALTSFHGAWACGGIAPPATARWVPWTRPARPGPGHKRAYLEVAVAEVADVQDVDTERVAQADASFERLDVRGHLLVNGGHELHVVLGERLRRAGA